MKKSVKLMMALVSCALLSSVVSCGGTTSDDGGKDCPVCPDSGDKVGGKVLNIWAWNDEFQGRLRQFYPDYVSTDANGNDLLRDGTTIKWTIHANDNNGYQVPLDEALKNQESAATDDKIDMFLSEADYITKYKDSDYTLDVKKDVGITDDYLSDQYKYTQQVATSSDGALKGVTWQATPGLYAYRTDLAEKVFGTSDPDKVQAKLADWSKFNAAAKTAKDAGVKILSGYDDAYRTYSNNVSKPWVDDKGVVSIDPMIKKWVDDTMVNVKNGYCGDTTLWSSGWQSDQGPKGNVLGFFYSTWGINFTLLGNSLDAGNTKHELGNGLFGKYRVCEGPASYYWGGTWMHACKGTDNIPEIKDIMEKLTCSRTVESSITRITEDYTNTVSGMHAIATDDTYASAFLGGQNHVALFEASASKIDASKMSAYDQGCNENFQTAMHDYFAGKATYEEALANFKKLLTAKYPEVTYDF